MVNDDIKCEGSDPSKKQYEVNCNKPTWKNSLVKEEALKNIHDKPVKKDTIVVPAGGYAVIRFKADNPGNDI